MHPKQKAFFSHPAKAKALLGGRQGGKTRGVSLWLCADWEKYPGGTAVYITKTAKDASRRCWPQIKMVCRQAGIKVKYHESDLKATFPNGYVVWCTGCKDKGEADKVRGEASGFQKIAVDEPATFSDDLLEYLMTEVVDPTLVQTMGDLVLCGTPGPVPTGFWHSICTKMGWHVGTFTMFDNPFLPDPHLWLRTYMGKYGYTKTTPKVLREVFAQWVIDTESLVYISDQKDFMENNGYYELPTTRAPDFTTLGIDLGYAPDPCAFVIASSWWNRDDIWVQRAYTRGELTPDKIAAEIRSLDKQYVIHKRLVDGKGGGLTTLKALQQSYGIHCEGTPGGLKIPKIELMRGSISSRKLRVHLIDAQELVSDYSTILWSEDHDNHHPLSSDHNADAAIQACLPHKQFQIDFELEENKMSDNNPDKEEAFRRATGEYEDEY